MAWLSQLLWIQDAAGERIDAQQADGTYKPIVLQIDTGLTATASDNGSSTLITLTFDGASLVPSTRQVIAGVGLTQSPGTTLAADMTINVGAGSYIIGNANDIAVDATTAATPLKVVARDASGYAFAAALFAGDGTPTTPSIGFTSAPTTGLSYTSTNGGGTVFSSTGDLSGYVSAYGTAFIQQASSGGTPRALIVQSAENLAVASATPLIDFDISATMTFADAALVSQDFINIAAPTLDFTTVGTCGQASTLAIEGAPQDGPNATTTSRYQIWCKGSDLSKFEGPIGFPGGSVGAPGITSYADTDTGLYFPSANTVGISSGGVQSASFGQFAASITQQAGTASSPVAFTLTSAAHTNLTASVEAPFAIFDGSATCQWATGALALQRGIVCREQTLAFVGASVVAVAATHAVRAAPIAGTNATITAAYAYYAQAGISRFEGGAEINARTSVLQMFRLPGAITPAGGLTASVNDYSPAGLSSCSTILLDTDGAWNITGLNTSATGQVIYLYNISAANTFTLTHLDGASVASKQFLCPSGASVAVPPYGSVRLWYDTSATKWRVSQTS